MLYRLALIILAGSFGLCNSAKVIAQTDSFAGKIVFFGARRGSEENSTISMWSPAERRVVKFASSSEAAFLRGRVSPDAAMLAVAVASSKEGSSFNSPGLEIIGFDGRRRKIVQDAEVIAWFPDSKSILCRRGKKYGWSHFRVYIEDAHTEAVEIPPEDAVMDVWSDEVMCVMKGRPDARWQRHAGDFYPMRQLYKVSKGTTEEPFTHASEDCIWWRYRTDAADGAYYRRHYSSGRPIETAMLRIDSQCSQLIDFSELGVRPSGLPAWSPAGDEIAWVVQRETAEDEFENEMAFIRLNGEGARFVTANELGLSWLGTIDWR